MAHGVFEANSGFGVGLRTAGRVGSVVFRGFRLVLAGLSFWLVAAGGYRSMRFRFF